MARGETSTEGRPVYFPVIALGLAAGLLIYALPWDDLRWGAKSLSFSLDDGTRTVRVFVAPDLADTVTVEEWTGRPLQQRSHPDGTLEYHGLSEEPPAPRPGITVTANVGVWVEDLFDHRVLFSEVVPRDHEFHVHLSRDKEQANHFSAVVQPE